MQNQESWQTTNLNDELVPVPQLNGQTTYADELKYKSEQLVSTSTTKQEREQHLSRNQCSSEAEQTDDTRITHETSRKTTRPLKPMT